MTHIEASNTMLNHIVMLKDIIGIAALLQVKDSNALQMPSQHVLVANVYIHWDLVSWVRYNVQNVCITKRESHLDILSLPLLRTSWKFALEIIICISRKDVHKQIKEIGH